MDVEKKIHLVAQYLAAFAINYLISSNDDSHTNLDFDPEAKSLSTRGFGNKKIKLVFEYKSFGLKLESLDASYTLTLNGKSHSQILNWMGETLLVIGVKKGFDYTFHYEIPYAITDNFTFLAPAAEEIATLLSIRTLAHKSIREFLINNNFEGEIRVWPHHFDSGAFITINDKSNKQMGIGLAIADDMIDTPYFYAGGYDKNGSIDVSQFKELQQGDWVMNGFKGAVLKCQDLSSGIINGFFEASMKEFLK